MLHYKPKRISEIDFKKDKKVAIVGRVLEVGEKFFIISDTTERIEVESEESVEEGEIVRVFCSIEENKIKADIVQRLDGLDLNLYRKTEELYKKMGG